MVPNGWKNLQISDICKLQNGNSFKPHQWDTKGLPIIRIQNLNGSENFNYYSGEINERWLVETGQLLFSWAGTRGVSFGPFIWKKERGVLNQHIYKVYANEVVCQEWLYNALKWVTNKIEAQAHGFKATLLHVQKKDIENQLILVPPLDEQRKISKILFTWNEAINTTESLINNSIQQKKALMQQLLTGKKRLFDDSGKPFDGDWEEVSLSKCLIEYKEKSTIQDQYRVFTSSKSGIVPQDEYFTNSRITDRKNIGFHIIPPMHMTYRSRSDDGFFTFNLFKGKGNGVISNYYPVFTSNGVNLFFIALFEQFRTRFGKYSVGTSQKVLSFNALKSIHFKIPKVDEQRKISTVFNNANKEIESLKKQLADLKQEKKALMQQLLTGNRRVKIN
jgi:type I restriction enzyme S subunit